MKFIFILLLILLILFLLLLIPAKVEIKASLKKADIKVSFLCFKIPTQKEKKPKKKNKKKKNALKKIFGGRPLSYILSFVSDTLKAVIKKVGFVVRCGKVEELSLDVKVAAEDAAAAAIEYGAVCAVVYPLVSLVCNYNKALKENINISCDYNEVNSELDFYLKVSVRLIHLITVLSILPAVVSKLLKRRNKYVQTA